MECVLFRDVIAFRKIMKKIEEKFEKPLDKNMKVRYNIYR